MLDHPTSLLDADSENSRRNESICDVVWHQSIGTAVCRLQSSRSKFVRYSERVVDVNVEAQAFREKDKQPKELQKKELEFVMTWLYHALRLHYASLKVNSEFENTILLCGRYFRTVKYYTWRRSIEGGVYAVDSPINEAL